MLHITLQYLYLMFYSNVYNLMQAFHRVSCFEFFSLTKMSRLTFANVFNIINDEYGTHLKENGEEVLNAIREENFFNENNDHDNFVAENEEFLPFT